MPLTVRILLQRIRESGTLQKFLIAVLSSAGMTLHYAGFREAAFNLISQCHRSTTSDALRRYLEPRLLKHERVYHQAYTASDPDALASNLGGRMLVLKPRVSDDEKGIILVKFSELLSRVASSIDLPELFADYHLVFEPSWSGYCDRDVLFYSQFEDPVFFLAAEEGDFNFLSRLNNNLQPVLLGPCDWVDPEISSRFLGSAKRFDIVMNSNWGAWKRHHVLFRTLRRLPEKYSIALIGFPWRGQTVDDVQQLARHYEVEDQLTYFDTVSFEDVMRINCESRMAVLLSLKEGSNRAVSESLFCNIPAIVLEEHVGGIRKNIVPATGILTPERELPRAIEQMLNSLSDFTPRSWAIRNISCNESTKRLNSSIKCRLLDIGYSWTRDIAERSNSPELRYVSSADAEELLPHTESLKGYLKKSP